MCRPRHHEGDAVGNIRGSSLAARLVCNDKRIECGIRTKLLQL
jgi:hypothetical protein